jgi:hypothetical protein
VFFLCVGGVLTLLEALNDGPGATLLFVLAGIAVLWGPIAFHEGGHAVAAWVTGNRLTEVRIGSGLQLAKLGVVTVSAVPVSGRAFINPNRDTLTKRREVAILAAGPAAHFVAAVIMFVVAIALSDRLVVVLAAMQGASALANLSPRASRRDTLQRDGVRIWALLRGRVETTLEPSGGNPGVHIDRDLVERAFRDSVRPEVQALHRRQADRRDDQAGEEHQA